MRVLPRTGGCSQPGWPFWRTLRCKHITDLLGSCIVSDKMSRLSSIRRRSTPPASRALRLVVEVADRSLADDQCKKLAGYARAGIPVYWIINLPGGQVEVYTGPDPAAGQYGNLGLPDRQSPATPVGTRCT